MTLTIDDWLDEILAGYAYELDTNPNATKEAIQAIKDVFRSEYELEYGDD